MEEPVTFIKTCINNLHYVFNLKNDRIPSVYLVFICSE